MKSVFLTLVACVSVSVSAQAQTQAQTQAPAQAPASIAQPPANRGTDLVICSADSTKLNVYSEDLENVEFVANPFEAVLPVQITDGDQVKTKIVDGQAVSFTQIQSLTQDDDENNRGWVEESLVVPASSCEQMQFFDVDAQGFMAPARIGKLPTETSRINGEACCTFPIKSQPQASFVDGMRMFGFPRAHGNRVHAACDLYRNLGDPVIAIDDGEVVLPPTPFYGIPMTCELEIRHTGGEIARYGEILCRRAPGIALHARVKKGQVVGYVGFTGAVQPMLHFELYSGTQTGPLTVRATGGFERRGDLLNPTEYLLGWEKRSLGGDNN